MEKKKQRKRRKRGSRQEHKGKLSLQRWLMIGGAVALVALIAFAMRGPDAPPVDAARLADDPTIGAASPVVEIVEYGDFGCHSCQTRHRLGIKEQVLEAYGDKVRFVWRDFPVITAYSPKAAEAAQCAHDQGQFWAYHDILYERAPAIQESSLKAYAEEIGLDTDAFNTCLDSGQHRATVNHDLQAGRDLRVRGTPSFTVNGQLLTGPPTFDVLSSLIEAQLGGG